MSIDTTPPVSGGDKNYQIPSPETEPQLKEGMENDSDQKDLQKTAAEKSQFENIPKALKNTAKLLMKVATAPPAFALDFGGGILKNVGFFIRTVPMVLGQAIGEKVAPSKDDVYLAKQIGRVAGFVIASPITIPAIAIEFMGRAAHLAGNLHLKANIKEEIDLGVYLKHHLLGRSPASIKREYGSELLKKDPSLTVEIINEKFKVKFRNQKELQNLRFDDEDMRQHKNFVLGDLQEKREKQVKTLKEKYTKENEKDNYINEIENVVKKQCESLKLPPEFTHEIVNKAKADASNEFPIFIKEKRALKELDRHVKKIKESFKAPDSDIYLELGTIKAFLEKNPQGQFLLENENRKAQLITHLKGRGITEEGIALIFKSKM